MGSDDVHSKFLSPTISKLLLIVSNRATKCGVCCRKCGLSRLKAYRITILRECPCNQGSGNGAMRYRWLMEAMPTIAMLIPLEAMAMMVMVMLLQLEAVMAMVVTTEELTADELTTAMLKAVALTAVTVMLMEPAPKLVEAMVKLMELLTTVANLTQLKAMETELPS